MGGERARRRTGARAPRHPRAQLLLGVLAAFVVFVSGVSLLPARAQTVPPDAPTNATAVAGDGQTTVSWTAPASDGGSPITSYTVTSSPDGLVTSTPDGTVTTVVVTGLTNGTAYTFTVVATSAAGTSAPSAPSNSVTPTGVTAPTEPLAVAATAGNGQATASWAPPASDGGSPITSYTVTSSPDGLTATTLDGATASAVVTGLTNGTAYTFTVIATNAVGDSISSAPSVEVTPAAPTVSDPPTNVAATAGDAEATVTWTPPASDGGSPITWYTVTSSPDGLTATTLDGTTTNAVVTALTNGTAYTFTVVATNALGDSAGSAPSLEVTPGPTTVPDPPSTVLALAGDAEATVSWTAPASDGGSPITSYTVTPSPGGLTAITLDGSTTNAVVATLANGTAYTFTVVATNALGDSNASAPSNSVTPLAATVPGAPTGAIAVAGDTAATVSWVAPASDGGSPITSYTVISSPDAISATTLDGATTSATVAGLTNGTAYTFTVVATNALGDSIASALSLEVTPGLLIGPLALAAPGPGQRQFFLHAADVTVGTTTFETMTEAAVAGAVATVSVPLSPRRVDVRLEDQPAPIVTKGVFVSDLVPAGMQWDIGGSWNFEVWMDASTGGERYEVRARIWRVPVDGSLDPDTATPLHVTGYSAQVDATTTPQLVDWTATVPSTTLLAGQRIGVTFYVFPDADTPEVDGILSFDEATVDSNVIATITETAAPGQVRNSHYRIGQDQPLASALWFAGTDSPATNFAKNQPAQLRFQVYDDSLGNIDWSAQIEWSTSPGSGFSAVPLTPGAAPFYVVDTVSFVNGDAIAIGDFGLGTSPGAAQAGIAYDTENPAATPTTLNGSSFTEIAFTIFVATNAVDGQDYYFRLSNAVTPLVSYDVGAAQIRIGFPLPPPPAEQPPAHNFHQPYSADTSACAACHRAHTGAGPTVLYKAWPEEEVCFTCHDGSAAPDIFTQFGKPFQMPIGGTEGVHSKEEALIKDPLAFRGANRHIECVDCHNPHFAGQGNHTIGSNYAFGPQQGVWGVSVTNTTAWSAPAFTTVNPITFQYELCFKCHSSWAYGGSPPLSPSGGFPETDQAVEFNTLNAAYHPVEDVGRNPFTLASGGSYASSLINGFTPSSRMVCSDCHGSNNASLDPAGPHGSTNPFILTGAWDRTTGRAGTENHLCFTCHAFSTYGEGGTGPTGFSESDGNNLHGVMVGGRNRANNDEPIGCMDCHLAIPHGYFRDHLIGLTNDGAPYVNRPYAGGLVQIDQWRASGQWVFSSCSTAMNSCK